MKNSAYAILLIFLILATGCSNTATPADDKAFYDKANSAGLSIAENFENKIELAIESGDYDAAALICNQAGSQYSELADDLEKMPVTENMASVKKEYVSGYRSFQQAMVAGTDVAKYSKINDTKKAGASYEIVTMNTDAAKTHFVAAKTLYGNLVKLTITTTPTPKSGYIISISHPYSWEGNYGDTDSQKSINGQNGKEIPIDHISGALSIVVQKKGGDSEHVQRAQPIVGQTRKKKPATRQFLQYLHQPCQISAHTPNRSKAIMRIVNHPGTEQQSIRYNNARNTGDKRSGNQK